MPQHAQSDCITVITNRPNRQIVIAGATFNFSCLQIPVHTHTYTREHAENASKCALRANHESFVFTGKADSRKITTNHFQMLHAMLTVASKQRFRITLQVIFLTALLESVHSLTPT